MAIRSVFYGWWVVAAFSFMTCISTGIRHAVGPFLKPIVADLGLDRASFSLVIALSSSSMACSARSSAWPSTGSARA